MESRPIALSRCFADGADGGFRSLDREFWAAARDSPKDEKDIRT